MKTVRLTSLVAAALALAPQAAPAQVQAPARVRPPTQAFAPGSPIPAPLEPDAIPLYGEQTPGSAASEIWSRAMAELTVRNVTHPTLTPVLPARGKATGAAVIVAPGGGFMALSMTREGFAVAQALAERGITAFVLKYRLLPTPADEQQARLFLGRRIMEATHGGAPLANPDATADGQAALALVRRNAARWGVDPARVGMIGFSAGAMTALEVVKASADPVQGPAFFGYIYGPQDAIAVPAGAPPMFDAFAFDDPLFPFKDAAIAQAWRSARRPVELHVYQTGQHGFGLGWTGTSNALLTDEFVAWLSMQGFLKQADHKQ